MSLVGVCNFNLSFILSILCFQIPESLYFSLETSRCEYFSNHWFKKCFTKLIEWNLHIFLLIISYCNQIKWVLCSLCVCHSKGRDGQCFYAILLSLYKYICSLCIYCYYTTQQTNIWFRSQKKELCHAKRDANHEYLFTTN